ncbi:hypothetical protein DMENIID0001_059540 [Sergentomyia squamirostris]
MKFLAAVVVISGFLSGTLAKPGLTDDVAMFKDACMQETNATAEDLQKFNSGDNSGDNSTEKSIGCFADCITHKLGFFRQDHTLDQERVTEVLSSEIPPENVQEFLQKCSDKVGKEPGEISLNWLKCDATILKKIIQ